MIKLTDKDTGAPIGNITEEQLQFLIDQLVEETATDQDYYLNRDQLAVFEEQGADAELVSLLKAAMGDRADMEIVWSKA